MSAEIHVTGPHLRRSHVGTISYWKVVIVNDEVEETLDLVPWNERGSLTRH